MRSAHRAAFSSSSARFRPTSENSFQMPAYTSHTSRASPAKARNLKQQTPARPLDTDDIDQNEAQACSESDQNLLAMLNSTVACLKEKHMDIEALGCMEQSLWLKRRMFGIESPAVHKALHEVVLCYNSIAMQFLAQSQFDQCLSMLRKAEAITAPPGNFKNCQSLQILTYNNIGCCYRKLGKLKSALKYLKEAAQVGAGCAHVKNLSITHLNLCAIQSQLGRHDLALEHAQAAIFHTQEELVSLDGGDKDGERQSDDVLDAKSREEKIISLAVAYHNLAVELEFNARGEASLQWYKKALQLVARFQESNQTLYESFEKIFLDAKRKHQGTHRQQPQPTMTATGNRATRPRSAHASTRSGSNPVTRSGVTPRDVSYSATVASQCYKPTKPSTAELQYTRMSPSKPGSRYPTTTFPQRPSSATNVRRRPMSASSSRQTASSRNRTVDERLVTEDTVTSDMIDSRWKQIERDLFGNTNTPVTDNANATTRPQSVNRARPQSARHTRNVSQSRNPEQSHFHVVQNAQTISMDEPFVEDDDECGIVQDEGDDEELEAQFHATHQPTNSKSVARGTPLSARGVVDRREPVPKIIRTHSAKGEQQTTASARHRQALQASRNAASTQLHARVGHHELEDDSEGITSSGYAGEEDDSASLSESCDVPRQRVSHLEYLRRMKKLSDSIQDDLSSKGHKVNSAPTLPQGRLQSQSTTPKNPSSSERSWQDRNVTVSTPGRHTQEDIDNESSRTTPRSASKVRERLELVRRDSVKSLEMNDAMEGDHDVDFENTTTPAPGIVITETVHVFTTEKDILTAEHELLVHASARRIQSAARESGACRQFEVMRQRKEEERAKQVLAKRKIIEAKECELQAQRAVRQNDRDEAARIIQHAYRRELARETQLRSKQEIIESRERELQVQREACYTQRDGDDAARFIQGMFRRHLYDNEADERGTRNGQPDANPLDESNDLDNDVKERQAPPEAEGEDDDESAYTPLPTARYSTTNETSTHPSLLNTPRSSAGVTSNSSPLSSRSSHVSPRISSSNPFSLPLTPRNSAVSTTTHQPQSLPPVSSKQYTQDQHAAALRIQCAYRKHTASQHVTIRHARRLSRSYIERNHIRVVLAQATTKELSFLEELSAIKIQALARGRQARFIFEALLIGRHAAATTIQTLFRRHRHHVQFSSTRGVESIAARNIQRKYRAYATRQASRHQLAMYEEALEVHHIAAQTIQRCWRGWCVERDRKIEEWEAATCIQALTRGHLTRKSVDSLKASVSAFSIGIAASRQASRLFIDEEVDNYDENFDDDEATDMPSSRVIGPTGSATNLSFLPDGVRTLFQRYASKPELLPLKFSSTSADEPATMGLRLEELADQLETCTDVDTAVTLLDTMNALVDTDYNKFCTLPYIIRVARALEQRIHDTDFWVEAIETRAAAFILLYDHVLMTNN